MTYLRAASETAEVVRKAGFKCEVDHRWTSKLKTKLEGAFEHSCAEAAIIIGGEELERGAVLVR